MIDLKYFTLEEFTCSCCGMEWMEEETLGKLDGAREVAGVPFVVTSGCRCENQNRMVGGASSSAHLVGRAADISARYSTVRLAVVVGAIEAGFNRIGIYRNHVHMDDDPNAPPGVMWRSYK